MTFIQRERLAMLALLMYPAQWCNEIVHSRSRSIESIEFTEYHRYLYRNRNESMPGKILLEFKDCHGYVFPLHYIYLPMEVVRCWFP